MSNRNKKAQQVVVEDKLHEMLEWYVANNAGKGPDHLAVDEKGYRGKVLRWYEPQLPGRDNPILIEESLGDSWTLRIEFSHPSVTLVNA